MDSMTVITISGGLVNTRSSEISDLSKESKACVNKTIEITSCSLLTLPHISL